MYRVSGRQFNNSSRFTLAELINDPDHLAANFKSYLEGFSVNVREILNELDIETHIDKMDKGNRLFTVIKAFS